MLEHAAVAKEGASGSGAQHHGYDLVKIASQNFEHGSPFNCIGWCDEPFELPQGVADAGAGRMVDIKCGEVGLVEKEEYEMTTAFHICAIAAEMQFFQKGKMNQR